MPRLSLSVDSRLTLLSFLPHPAPPPALHSYGVSEYRRGNDFGCFKIRNRVAFATLEEQVGRAHLPWCVGWWVGSLPTEGLLIGSCCCCLQPERMLLMPPCVC